MRNLLGRRTIVASVVVLALLVAAAVGAWWWTAGRTADDVQVSWTSGPKCTGTAVRDRQGMPAIEAVVGMRCTIEVEVRNDGDHSVRLDHAVAPFVGPRTGAVVAADEEVTPEMYAVANGIDAAYPLDVELDAGERTSFAIVVRFRPQGCNDSGTVFFSSWPVITFETLHRTFERAAPETFAFHRDGRTPGCKTW